MNDTGSLRRLGADADAPLPDLVGTGGEERDQPQSLAHGDDKLSNHGPDLERLALLGGLLISHTGKAVLERDRQRDDNIARAVLVDPGLDLGQVLVLLADKVALGQVDDVDAGLRSEEEELVDDLDLAALLDINPARRGLGEQKMAAEDGYQSKNSSQDGS